ncbi:MAG: hypothetical protein ABIQ16_06250 [Polyangiaceae bacterium]
MLKLNGVTEQRVRLTVALINWISVLRWHVQLAIRVELRGHEAKRIRFWMR